MAGGYTIPLVMPPFMMRSHSYGGSLVRTSSLIGVPFVVAPSFPVEHGNEVVSWGTGFVRHTGSLAPSDRSRWDRTMEPVRAEPTGFAVTSPTTARAGRAASGSRNGRHQRSPGVRLFPGAWHNGATWTLRVSISLKNKDVQAAQRYADDAEEVGGDLGEAWL